MLLSIIGNILDFSKIGAGQLDLAAQPFDPRVCITEALDLITLDARQKGLTLKRSLDASVPSAVVGDGKRLRQVLVNLLGNAVKFTERGGVELTARGYARGDASCEITITVRDTGIGIPADRLPRIFDPFVQADRVTTRRYGGAGLGLAISKQLVDLMGGSISVTSVPGAGSTFVLTLPLSIADDAQAPARAVSPEPTTMTRCQMDVLIVEDNPINQEVLRRMVEQLGCTTSVVATGAAALTAVTRQAFDVVLMDIQMPELDGEEATRRIRALGSAIVQPSIIALTASALRGDRERYLAAGMDDYLSKPVQIDDLRRVLHGSQVTARHAWPAPAPLAPPAEQPGGPPAVDWSVVEELLVTLGMARSEAITMVLQLYRDEIPPQIDQLEAAIVAGDQEKVRRLAHTLRGSSRQMGAAAMAEHCTTLELGAQTMPAAALTAHLDAIRQTYSQALAQLTDRYPSS